MAVVFNGGFTLARLGVVAFNRVCVCIPRGSLGWREFIRARLDVVWIIRVHVGSLGGSLGSSVSGA